MQKKTFERLLEMVGEVKELAEGSKDKVVKTIKVKPEWKKNFDALEACRKEITTLENKLEALKRIAWAKVEQDTEIYSQMRYSREENVIKVLGDSEDEE